MDMPSTVVKITTGVDKLIALVNEREEISLSQAASEINVPKSTIEAWCSSLENKGVFTSRLTLNERYLMSNDYYNYKFNFLGSVTQNLKSLNTKKNVHYVDELDRKEQVIKTKLTEMDSKIKELRKLETLKLITNERLHSLKNLEKNFDLKEKAFAKEKKAILIERQELAKRRERHMEEQIYWNNKIKSFDMQKKLLRDKEKELRNTTKEFNSVIKNFEKNKKKFDKRRNKLAKQEMNFVSVLHGKIIKANNYLDRPLFTDAQFEALLKKLDSMKKNLE